MSSPNLKKIEAAASIFHKNPSHITHLYVAIKIQPLFITQNITSAVHFWRLFLSLFFRWCNYLESKGNLFCCCTGYPNFRQIKIYISHVQTFFLLLIFFSLGSNKIPKKNKNSVHLTLSNHGVKRCSPFHM